MAETATSTATLRLGIGDLKIAYPVKVPAGPVRATEVVPALQGLVNAVVEAAEMGKAISCRKGCGACCRQLVPISRTEGERLLEEIKAMPTGRQQRLRERFAAAEKVIAQSKLFPSPVSEEVAPSYGDGGGRLAPASARPSPSVRFADTSPETGEVKRKSDRELSLAYFALGIPCPFLEDESCSIHPVRPLVCREYLVTSPAELCSGPAQEGVTPVPVPKVSMAGRKLQDDGDDWFPLATLLAWARTRPKDAKKRPGMEWIQRFVQRLSVK